MNINTTASQKLAIENNYLCLPQVEYSTVRNLQTIQEVATIVHNMNYFGYMPSIDLFEQLSLMKKEDLVSFYSDIKPVFEDITGSNKNMEDFIVYKNFPSEVMSMSDSEYWIKQLFIYFGVGYDYLREDETPRPELTEKKTYKVLQPAKESLFEDIFSYLVSRSTRWTIKQNETAEYLYKNFKLTLDLSKFKFKDNGAKLSYFAYKENLEIKTEIANDILKMALSWSSMNYEMPVKQIKFASFKRPERRFLLNLLENSKTLEKDIEMKKVLWKKLFGRLNPSDYKVPRCKDAYDKLYNKKVKGFNSDFTRLLQEVSEEAITVAKAESAGFYLRNFHLLYKHFGYKALEEFIPLFKNLTIHQLVKLEKYISTENNKSVRIIAPKGNWSKSNLIKNNKVKFRQEDIDNIIPFISSAINEKLKKEFPNEVILSEKTKDLKLPTNDLNLDFFGRGSSFDIPENIKTLRVASYWEYGSGKNVWFDNGTAFLDENQQSIRFCTWNQQSQKGAYFSGDPLPSNNRKGRACQVIDLNIEELINNNTRYVLWSILSFNDMPFNEANEVFATLQFCEDANAGKIFEPSRAELSFDIKDNKKAKYVAYFDLVKRKVIFLDANMPLFIHSIASNRYWVADQFSALKEYGEFQPTIFDLFKHLENKKVVKEPSKKDVLKLKENDTFIGFSDENVEFNSENEQLAYLFKHTNESNKLNRLDLLNLLSKS